MARALEEAAGGRLRGQVHAVLPLAEAARAHELMEERRNVGMVLWTT